MQALQWDGTSLQLNHVEQPESAQNRPLIQIIKAGICNTDLEIMRGYYPFKGTLGHEFIGIVRAADNPDIIGKRVVCDINFACHTCSTCLAGNPHHCQKRATLGINQHDGAFAEFITAPLNNLVFVPDSLSDESAVFAEPVAAALEIMEQVDMSKIAEVVVIGDGKLGLLITLCLTSQGIDVTLLGHHPKKLALAKKIAKGANVTTFTSPPNKTFPVVIEATGNPLGFYDAIKLTQPKGTLVLKSTYAGGFEFNPAAIVINEITVIGSRCGPMQKAVDLLASNAISPEHLISNVYPLNDGIAAITRATQKGSLKVLLDISNNRGVS